MKIAIVCLSNNSIIQSLSETIAMAAKTNVLSKQDFDMKEEVDLLFVGINGDNFRKNKTIDGFIQSLSRQYIHNVVFFTTYRLSKKPLIQAIEEAKKQNLPLMRDSFECKYPLFAKELSSNSKSRATSYVQDMITIVEHYY